jgi:hypothetical protein
LLNPVGSCLKVLVTSFRVLSNDAKRRLALLPGTAGAIKALRSRGLDRHVTHLVEVQRISSALDLLYMDLKSEDTLPGLTRCVWTCVIAYHIPAEEEKLPEEASVAKGYITKVGTNHCRYKTST